MWKVVTSKGSLKCKILISACGALHKPSLPSIDGIQSFKGQSFHSANWDHEATLEGKTVGIVGSAASAVQIGRSWYKNKDGVNFVLWPSNLLQYWWMTAKPNLLDDFKIGFEPEYYNL